MGKFPENRQLNKSGPNGSSCGSLAYWVPLPLGAVGGPQCLILRVCPSLADCLYFLVLNHPVGKWSRR